MNYQLQHEPFKLPRPISSPYLAATILKLLHNYRLICHCLTYPNPQRIKCFSWPYYFCIFVAIFLHCISGENNVLLMIVAQHKPFELLSLLFCQFYKVCVCVCVFVLIVNLLIGAQWQSLFWNYFSYTKLKCYCGMLCNYSMIFA